MKKKFLVMIVLFSTSILSAQTTNQEVTSQLAKLINDIQNIKRGNTLYKQILNETVIVNSSSNARFYGGKTRIGFKINLPEGTQTWYYRITLLEPNSSYTYPYNSDFFSLLKNHNPLFINNQTNYGVDFFVLDDYSISNFLQTGNDNFRYYEKYSKKNTSGFINSCDLKSNNLWIGLKNPDISHGLKAIVEVVAIGNFN